MASRIFLLNQVLLAEYGHFEDLNVANKVLQFTSWND